MRPRQAARDRRVIRVPASVGNVGPGFDTLGLALTLYLRVTIRRRVEDGLGHYQSTGSRNRCTVPPQVRPTE